MKDLQETKTPVKNTTVGIVAYLTLIGLIIAIILNGEKKGEEKKFGAFHLRQSLGLIILAVGFSIAFAIVSAILLAISFNFLTIIGLLSKLLAISILVLTVLGIVNAANGKYKELPFIGKFSSKLLGKTFE